MQTDDTSPATKGDLKELAILFKSDLKGLETLFKSDLENTKTEILTTVKENLLPEFGKKFREDLVHDFAVLNEELVKEFKGAFKDGLSVHDGALKKHDARLTRIEDSLGLNPILFP